MRLSMCFLVCWFSLVLSARHALAETQESAKSNVLSLNILGEALDPGVPEYRGKLRIEPAIGGSPAESQLLEISLPGEAQILVDPTREWNLYFEVPGVWLPSVSMGAGTTALDVKAWPLTKLTGKARVAADATFPDRLQAHFKIVVPDKVPDFRHSTIDCPLGPRGDFQCSLPATLIDIRLEASSFAPVFLWKLALEPGIRNLEPFALVKGASVSGWVSPASDPQGRLIQVELSRRTHQIEQPRGEAEELGLQQFETIADSRGFFLLSGLASGEYFLRASHPTLGVSRRETVLVGAESHVDFSPDLRLEPPTPLEVFIDPPLDPYENPWEVALLRNAEYGVNARETVFSVKAGPSGNVSSDPVSPGIHFLRLMDSKGSSWLEQTLELSGESGPVFLNPSFVSIKGTVFLGSEPTMATVWFGGKHNRSSLRMVTNEEGEYSGWLPQSGEWPVEGSAFEDLTVSLGLVEVPESDENEWVEVDLYFPDTRLFGQVVSASGEAVEVPQVSIKWDPVVEDASTGRRIVDAQGDENGEFDLRGLPLGSMEIQAQDISTTATSQTHRSILEDGTEIGPLRLVLQEHLPLEVGLIFRGQPVVDGAVLVQSPLGPPKKARRQGTGIFKVELPKGTLFADLLVVVPGFASQLLRVTLDPSQKSPERTIVLRQGGGKLSIDFRGFPEPPSLPEAELLASLVLSYEGGEMGLQAALAAMAPIPDPASGGKRLTLGSSLAPGMYRLCGVSSELGKRCLDLVLTEQGESDFLLRELLKSGGGSDPGGI